MGYRRRLAPEKAGAYREASMRDDLPRDHIAPEAPASGVSSRARRRDDHLARIVAEDADLLRRLGGV